MPHTKTRVAVNGYDGLGLYISDAVAAQEDMELVGVVVDECISHAKAAISKGYAVYASTAHTAGFPVTGCLHDLLRQVDVVSDISFKNTNPSAQEAYQTLGVKAVFQACTPDSLAEHPFVAQANYTTAIGRNRTRVVSTACAAIVRTLKPLHHAGLLKKAHGILIGYVPVLCASDREQDTHAKVFSVEGCEAQTLLRGANIGTTSLGTLNSARQLHTWNVELVCPVTLKEILQIYKQTPRVTLLTAEERVARLKHPRHTGQRLWEVCLWLDSIAVSGRDLLYTYEVYNPAAIVAETIDAIRALAGNEKDAATSIAMTDRALECVSQHAPPTDWEI